jgi:hypothetical protein
LTLSRFVESDQAHQIGAFNSAQWTIAVAGDDNLVVRPNQKFCGLNDVTPIFPPSPQRIGNIAGDPITNRKRDLARHFPRLVDRIDGRGNDLGAQGVKLPLYRVEAD